MAKYSESEISALRKAIASGVLTVRHGETSTTFRSLREMREILAEMEEANNASGYSRRTVAKFYKGA